jgi:hypothetical protein
MEVTAWMRCLLTVSILLVLFPVDVARGKLIEVPRNITTLVGGRAEFCCVTNATNKWMDWTVIRNATTVFQYPDNIIFLDGRIVNRFRTRYTVTRDSNGVYTLSIQNVTFADEGTYGCQDGGADKANASLSVLSSSFTQPSTVSLTQTFVTQRITTVEQLKQDDSHQCHVAGKVAGAFFGGLFTGLFILLGGLWIYSRTHKSDKQMFSIFLQPFVDHHLATDNRTVENVHEAAKVDEG